MPFHPLLRVLGFTPHAFPPSFEESIDERVEREFNQSVNGEFLNFQRKEHPRPFFVNRVLLVEILKKNIHN